MKKDKPFLSIDGQIKKLKNERHLIINSEENAARLLKRYGYYEIINGYKENFLELSNQVILMLDKRCYDTPNNDQN